MAQLIWTGFAVVAGFVMVAVVLYFLVTEGGDRERDEAARVYFDEHGHWPGEPPEPTYDEPAEQPRR
jgi:hypothetical protein